MLPIVFIGLKYVALILLSLLFVWFIIFLTVNDLTVPTKKIESSKKLLVLFPHADDEILSAGGLVSQLAKNGWGVTWVIFTKGEKGTPNASIDMALKDIRVKEAEAAKAIYGVQKFIQKDFPDNALETVRPAVQAEIQKLILEIQPDVVITYDESGLYGHADHIVVSEEAKAAMKQSSSSAALWYVTQPAKLLARMSLPEHMAQDPSFIAKRTAPNAKIWVGMYGVRKKIQALYAYKSQAESFKNSFPIRIIPLWVYVTFAPYEYFHINGPDIMQK